MDRGKSDIKQIFREMRFVNANFDLHIALWAKMIFVLGMVGFIPSLNAQELSVRAKLDTALMLIGDQQKYSIIADQDKDWKLDFPFFGDTLIEKVEILERNVDTVYMDNRLIRVTHEYLITSFDSGFYVIPQQKIKIQFNQLEDSVLTDELFLFVNTFQIDSIQGIVDIKPPKEAPVTFKEVLPWLFTVLGILVAILGMIWVYRRYFKKEKSSIQTFERKILPHVLALDAMEELKRKKLWQQGKVKDFHSELTEILRRYLENRFQVQALEQTSDEIIESFQTIHLLNYAQLEQLKEVLILADYVKFAKLEPEPDQNEKSFSLAWDLIMQTRSNSTLNEESDQIEKNKGEEAR
jgi:hypothetical protein